MKKFIPYYVNCSKIAPPSLNLTGLRVRFSVLSITAISFILLLFSFLYSQRSYGQTLLDNYDGVGDLTYTTEGTWLITGGQYEGQNAASSTPEHSYASYDLTGSIAGWDLNKANTNTWFGWMDLNRSLVSGWGGSSYSCGMVLAANNTDFNSGSPAGYAVVFRNSPDELVLVKFSGNITSGTINLWSGTTELISSGYTYLDGDNGVNFFVEFLSDGTWKISYLAGAKLSDANATNSANYTGGSATSANDETYTGATYKYAGWVYAHSSAGGQVAYFDNFGAGQGGGVTADRLTFTNIPGSCREENQTFSVTVCATDASLNVDNTYTGTITVSKASGPGTLSGTLVLAATAGCATFADLSFDAAGAYTLSATDGSLTDGISGSFTISVSCSGSGIIINEFSNGPAGSQEYVELLVVGAACSTVDIRGYIVDDNNGASNDGFSTKQQDAGVAPGYIEFDAIARWASVPVGSIILIYNNGDKNPAITQADDPDDTGTPDSVYILPANDAGLIKCSTTPSGGGGGSSDYSPCGLTAPGSWTTVAMRNLGDAIQVRNPDGTYFHGISYGSSSNNMTGGPDNLNVLTSSGTGKVFYFNDTDYRDVANFTAGNVPADETPGAANNAANAAYINNLSNLGDPAQPAAADTSRCAGGSQDLTVSPTVAGYNYVWYDAPLGGNQLGTGSAYTVDPVLIGATNYYVGAVSTAGGCVGVRDTVVLTGTDTPPAFTGSPFTQCATGFITLTVDPSIAGATYVWYNLVSGGTVLQSSTDFSYDLLVPTGPNDSLVWVSVIESGCDESSRTEGVASVTGDGTSPTTWDGSVSTDWFDDNNWDNCTPSCYLDAVIPTAGVNEPSILFANGGVARVRNIEIQSGGTLTFGDSLAKLNVCGDWTQGGAISMPDSGLVAFVSATGSQLITTAAGPFNILQINNTSSTPLVTLSGAAAANVTINATGELRLTNGVLETTIDKAVVVLNTDEDAVTGSSTASYIWGNLTRYILAAGGIYDFPVGNGGSFQLFNINISAVGGLSYLNVFFENTSVVIFDGLALLENGGVYDTILDNGGSIGGVWTMTPDNPAATTDYDLTLYGRDYGLTFVDSAHTIVKRVDNTPPWTLAGTYDSAGTGVIGGVVVAKRTAYSGFSQVAIAASKTPAVVLPIELLYFTGYAKGTYVVLEWITVSEENNDHFNIQRSKDGKNFETIGTIPGAGTSNDIRDYLHVDDKPNKGVNYYRLKQTDFDGQESFSEIIKVNVNTGVFEIGNIYPVPAEGSVVITFNSNSEDVVNLTIFDITGKESMSDKYYAYVGFNSVSVNVSDLAKGVYFLHLEKNGERIYKKMLKD
ncbi:MAG: T9SS type A sorting domain-containing protein [Cytophagales bacterium]|nr:T9SS type A sorting domain-containing protein [Cytophagales bacterium]